MLTSSLSLNVGTVDSRKIAQDARKSVQRHDVPRRSTGLQSLDALSTVNPFRCSVRIERAYESRGYMALIKTLIVPTKIYYGCPTVIVSIERAFFLSNINGVFGWRIVLCCVMTFV